MYTMDFKIELFHADLEGFYNYYMDYGTPTQNRPHNHCFYYVAHFQLDPAVSFNDVKQISGKKLSLVRLSDFNGIGEPD